MWASFHLLQQSNSILKISKVLFFLIFPLILFSCDQKKGPSVITPAFYYWKTTAYNWQNPPESRKENYGKTMDSLQVKKTYLRLFDIDWDEFYKEPVPIAPIDLDWGSYYSEYELPTDHEYVFVVFLTSRIFEKSGMGDIIRLASNISTKVLIYQSNLLKKKARVTARKLGEDEWGARGSFIIDSLSEILRKQKMEIQFDCDWTNSTKDKYFAFLKSFKSFDKKDDISATIRLDQYKNFKERGVPPVDRGMLMCYNVGNFRNPTEKNSIFNVKEIKKYLNGDKYPLELDIALPVFHWMLWYRDNQFKSIVNGFNLDELSKDGVFTNEDGMRACLKDTVISNYYFRRGDRIRIEQPEITDVLEVVELLKTKIDIKGKTVAIFDYDKVNLEKYGLDKVASVFRAFN